VFVSSKNVGHVTWHTLTAHHTLILRSHHRNLMQYVGIFLTQTSVILAVCVSNYCKPCLIWEKYSFLYL